MMVNPLSLLSPESNFVMSQTKAEGVLLSVDFSVCPWCYPFSAYPPGFRVIIPKLPQKFEYRLHGSTAGLTQSFFYTLY